MSKKALVVFSGGQDSTTCLYWALKNFDQVEAITFDYGQKHSVELECAKAICEKNKVPQKVVQMDFLKSIGGSALTDDSIEMKEEGGMNNLPSTFVPGRNALFLTMASAYAATREIFDVVAGVCQTDFSGYPDCRQEFVDSQAQTMSLALDHKVKFHTPLMYLTKAQTFKLAEELDALNSVIEDSHTCYQGNHESRHEWGYGCGQCPACKLRAKGYAEFSST